MTPQAWIEASSPNHGSARPRTEGIVVHSTRGGAEPGIEFEATLGWFARAASEVSAHVVIGRDGRRAHVVGSDRIAWHAGVSQSRYPGHPFAWYGYYNRYYLSVELEQPTAQFEYTDEQYRLLALWILEMHQVYGFPLDRAHLVGHDEIQQGRLQGKSDPGQQFDWAHLLHLLMS